MGLDVTDKLLCCFVMALGNDGITHLTIKSYLSAVHWPGSRIQRVPRSCGTSKETRPLCLLLGALYDWAVPSHHTPKHGATMLTTIPGAMPMIDNSGRRLTTINTQLAVCIISVTSAGLYSSSHPIRPTMVPLQAIPICNRK